MAIPVQVPATVEDSRLFRRGDSSLLCLGWPARLHDHSAHVYRSRRLWLWNVLQVKNAIYELTNLYDIEWPFLQGIILQHHRKLSGWW